MSFHRAQALVWAPKPDPIYLKAGDAVEAGIEQLGSQKAYFIPFKQEA